MKAIPDPEKNSGNMDKDVWSGDGRKTEPESGNNPVAPAWNFFGFVKKDENQQIEWD